jgi:hypothetical protein
MSQPAQTQLTVEQQDEAFRVDITQKEKEYSTWYNTLTNLHSQLVKLQDQVIQVQENALKTARAWTDAKEQHMMYIINAQKNVIQQQQQQLQAQPQLTPAAPPAAPDAVVDVITPAAASLPTIAEERADNL